MELSPSWEAIICAVTQILPSILRNLNVHYHGHKNPSRVPILSLVRWVPSHQSMLRPRVAGGGDSLQTRKVTASILNKQSRTANKGWSSSMRVGCMGNTSSPWKIRLLQKVTKGLGCVECYFWLRCTAKEWITGWTQGTDDCSNYKCYEGLFFFLYIVLWGGMRLSPFHMLAANWHVVPTPFGRMRISRRNWNTQRKPATVPFCPPQILYDLTWDRTRAFVVGCWQLTTWAMARPTKTCYSTPGKRWPAGGIDTELQNCLLHRNNFSSCVYENCFSW
jgi:hypothetical protein